MQYRILVVASKETGLEVNADKTKYVLLSGNQDAGRSRNINSDDISCERARG